MDVYPLVFKPIFHSRVWGGRRLETILNKQLPGNDPIGESWEVADLPLNESEVAHGPAAGMTLATLLREWGRTLMGSAPCNGEPFPLLIKFLDAREALSVQVHPKGVEPSQPAALPKSEAWYVVDAPADGYIYRGFREGVGPDDILGAKSRDDWEAILCRIPVRRGHCYYVPGGTVHALGPGLLVAEVQTPSDTTYRLFDWERLDPRTGAMRPLHVERALESLDFDRVSFAEERREHVGSLWTSVTTLLRCEFFTIERVRMVEGASLEIPYAELVIWIVLEGRGTIHHAGVPSPTTFARGDTVVLPAGLKQPRVETQDRCLWLEVTLPLKSALSEFPRLTRGELRKEPERGFVPLRVPERP